MVDFANGGDDEDVSLPQHHSHSMTRQVVVFCLFLCYRSTTLLRKIYG